MSTNANSSAAFVVVIDAFTLNECDFECASTALNARYLLVAAELKTFPPLDQINLSIVVQQLF